MKGFLLLLLFFCTPSNAQLDLGLPSLGLSSVQVVKFPNTACNASNGRIGTCYTAEECSDNEGTASGTCASGYGVCCTRTIACGESSKENNTYFVMTQTFKPTTTLCSHTILPLNNDICRIKFDFTIFSIAAPVTGTTLASASTPKNAGAVGTCTRDTFSVVSPGNLGTPIICGFNTGQHMFVDAVPTGSVAKFTFNTDSVSRQYDIRVLQYECGDTQGGPPDCLQYFTGASGSVASYNFPTTSTTIGATVTHLANQHYSACFRRQTGMCTICFVPAIAIASTNSASIQSSFGLSHGGSSATQGTSGIAADQCENDYITIPFGTSQVTTAQGTSLFVYTADTANKDNKDKTDLESRFCGRILAVGDPAGSTSANAITAAIAYKTSGGISICSMLRPFRVSVDFDDSEDFAQFKTSGATVTHNQNNVDYLSAPGGIIGFNLNWKQLACTS